MAFPNLSTGFFIHGWGPGFLPAGSWHMKAWMGTCGARKQVEGVGPGERKGECIILVKALLVAGNKTTEASLSQNVTLWGGNEICHRAQDGSDSSSGTLVRQALRARGCWTLPPFCFFLVMYSVFHSASLPPMLYHSHGTSFRFSPRQEVHCAFGASARPLGM